MLLDTARLGSSFKLRELKPMAASNEERTVKFMSYNVLTQALCKESRYPTNGDALNWRVRFSGFERELRAYKPDILLLQEVDVRYMFLWKRLLKKIGLKTHYEKSLERTHGFITAWSRELWHKPLYTEVLCYDECETPGVPIQCETESRGLVIVLEPVSKSWEPIIVANTHLYYHPLGDYERCRQLLVLLRAIEAAKKWRETDNIFFGGDFNSCGGSAAFQLLFGDLKESVLAKLDESIHSDMLLRETLLPSGDRVPFRNTLLQEFAKLELKFQSAYSNYALVDPQNVNPSGEPKFTNWTDDFKETVDYLLTPVASGSSRIKVHKLLWLPTESDMGPEPNSLPRINFYPSDHLAIMAEYAWEKRH